MKLKEWFKSIWKSLKEGEKRRFSVEPIAPFVTKTAIEPRFRFVDPAYPREALRTIERVVMNTPILAQTHNLMITLANTGHYVEVLSSDNELRQKAEEEINFLAYALNMDHLVFLLLSQIALYGCISAEIIVAENLSGVKKLVRVPPATIFFEFNPETQDYEPWQWVGPDNPIKLNSVTYKYLPLITIDGSPYAIPPMLSALNIVETYQEFVAELKGLARKVGLLGFLDISFPQAAVPRAPSETETEYMERARKYLENMAEVIAENVSKGILLHFEGVEAEFKEIKTDSGIEKLLGTLEKWQVAGAKGQPALVGFAEGYTETWATVALYIFVKQVEAWQRLVKRLFEFVYKLHLALKGLFVEDVNVHFNPVPSFHPEREAEMKFKEIQGVVSLLQAGVITPEEARKLLKLE